MTRETEARPLEFEAYPEAKETEALPLEAASHPVENEAQVYEISLYGNNIPTLCLQVTV